MKVTLDSLLALLNALEPMLFDVVSNHDALQFLVVLESILTDRGYFEAVISNFYCILDRNFCFSSLLSVSLAETVPFTASAFVTLWQRLLL